MNSKDLKTLELLLKEYGMTSGVSTPVGQQASGEKAKASAAARTSKSTINTPSKSPTIQKTSQSSADEKPVQPVIAKAKELKKDFEFPDEKGNVVKVVSPVGQGKNKDAVVVQNQKNKEFYTLQPDDDVALPQVDQEDITTEDSAALSHIKSRKLRTGKKGQRTIHLGRKIKKLAKLVRKHKLSEAPLFEINFNDPKLAKSALSGPIACGFEAETVWTNLSGEEGADLDNMSVREIMRQVEEQEGYRAVERIDEAFREWLTQSEYFYNIESDVIGDLVNDRKEDEDYLNRYIDETVDTDAIENYKEEKLSEIDKDEAEEYADWDIYAWGRQYVEENEEAEFEEWLADDIRDNGEQWDDAWELAYSRYDVGDYVNSEYSGNWYRMLSDNDVYLANTAGTDAVATEIESWAVDNSMTNDVRPGSYHSGRSVDNTYWRVEEDSSIEGAGAGAEIISPVYETPEQMLVEMKSLFEYLDKNDVETNDSTGLHVTMSWTGDSDAKLNKLKMALLLGDQYALKQFDRENNHYTQSQYKKIQEYLNDLTTNINDEKSLESLEAILSKSISMDKFRTIHFKDAKNDKGNNLIEFRIAGGESYHQQYDKMVKMVIRYAAVMRAGYDTTAHRQDYIKAIFRAINGSSEIKDTPMLHQGLPEHPVVAVLKDMYSKKYYLDGLSALSNAFVFLNNALKAKGDAKQGELFSEAEDNDNWQQLLNNAQTKFADAVAVLAIDAAAGKLRSPVNARSINALRTALKDFRLNYDTLWQKIQSSGIYRRYTENNKITNHNKLKAGVDKLFKTSVGNELQPAFKLPGNTGNTAYFINSDLYRELIDQGIIAQWGRGEPPEEGKPKPAVNANSFVIIPEQELKRIRDIYYSYEDTMGALKRDQEMLNDLSKDHSMYDNVAQQVERYQQNIDEFTKELEPFKKKYGFIPPSVKHNSTGINFNLQRLNPEQLQSLAHAYNIGVDVAESTYNKLSKLSLEEQLKLVSKIDSDKLNEAWTKKYKNSINCSNPKGFSQKAHCAGKKKKATEGAVPDNSKTRKIQQILGKPLLANDLGAQMEAYFAVPDPSMIKAFRQARAEGGDTVDLRSIFRSFIDKDLHPAEKKKAGLKESIVKEAKGIMGRVAGDKFVRGDQQLEFQSVTVYPEDGQQFDSPEQRNAAVAEFEKQTGSKIEWTNTPNNGTLAFGIATLTDPLNNDAPVYWGRYFRAKMVDMMGSWGNNQVPTGWKLQKAGAMKLDLGIDPQHLIRSEKLHKSIKEIASTVKRNSEGHAMQAELVEGLNQISKGQNPVFKNAIQNLPALRDYFGEIMGPAALMAGMVGGQAEDANRELLKGVGWDKCRVFWPQSMNYALVDSVFVGPNGEEVGVSSKGGKGARASAKNIADAINKAPPKLVRKYKTTVDIIKIVEAESAQNAPFRLAEMLGILPAGLEDEISKYIRAGKTDYDRLSRNAKELFNYGTPRQDVPGFNTGYALLALLAKKVAAAVNQKPDFSDGCIAFLNQSSIVQLYCKMGKSGNDARVTGWDAVYPPNFQGRVVLDGSKNYYSSRIGGKFAFGFV